MILRGLDLGDHEETVRDVGNMRKEMMDLRERNHMLERHMKRIERDENMLKQKVDLDDKLALKKLVVMLKAKNDDLQKQQVERPARR